MPYKLASRENVNSDKFELWPAVLNVSFAKFGNRIEPYNFNTDDEIIRWLDSKCKTKILDRITNLQDFCNGDPNRLYSVYKCDHSDKKQCYRYMYSLRFRKSSEAIMTYLNDKGDRIKSSFKKIDSGIEFFNNDSDIVYSSDIRQINGELYEGIYPIDIDEHDPNHVNYMNYVNHMHINSLNTNPLNTNPLNTNPLNTNPLNTNPLDTNPLNTNPLDTNPLDTNPLNTNMLNTNHMRIGSLDTGHSHDDSSVIPNHEYAMVFAGSGGRHVNRWLNKFVKKLEIVQRYLTFFAKGGDSYISIVKDDDHDPMIHNIFKILADNKQNTLDDDMMQLNIRNMVVDPYLNNGELYQVRYEKTLLNWHKNYAYIITKLNMMPSKQFADMILNFSLMDFFKQIHTRENLDTFIKNIENIYGISHKKNALHNSGVMEKNHSDVSKFIRVVKSFVNNDIRTIAYSPSGLSKKI